MAGNSTPLDAELIQRFERALFSAVPGYETHLQPGLSWSEIDDVTASLPGSLPDEAYVWWSWRNGLPSFGPHERPSEVPPTFGSGEYRLSSIEESMKSYVALREFAKSQDQVPADLIAPSGLFPIELSHEFSLLVTPERQKVSPVIWTIDDVEAGTEVAPSLGCVISWWAESLESGGLAWTRSAGWTVDEYRVAPDLTKWGFT